MPIAMLDRPTFQTDFDHVESAPDRLITGEEFLAMNDEENCELINGRIVRMGWNSGMHTYFISTLDSLLRIFVVGKKLGYVLAGDVGIYIRRNPDSVRCADIAFYSKERLPEIPTTGFMTIAPNLAVEIISPGSTFNDMMAKVEEYFAIGVERVWLVSPSAKSIWVCHSPADWKRLNIGDTLSGEGALAGFELPLAVLFDINL